MKQEEGTQWKRTSARRRREDSKLRSTIIKGRSYNYERPGAESYVLDDFEKRDFCKVLIGIPSIQDPMWRFVLAMNSIGYPPNFTKTSQICHGREVGEARNHIAEYGLKINANYLLFLDDDVFCPPDIFVRLLSHKKDIVSGLYVTKSRPSYPLTFSKEGAGCYTDWKLGQLVKVWGCGLGATLINMRVFREGKIPKPWFKTTKLEAVQDKNSKTWSWRSGTEDLYFYSKVQDAGYSVYVDTKVQCTHHSRSSSIDFPIGGFDKWYREGSYKT